MTIIEFQTRNQLRQRKKTTAKRKVWENNKQNK